LKDISSSTKQYDSAYSDAMKRIQGQVSDQTELAMQVLTWITCAKRPLTTVELQTALAVEVDESDFDEDNVPDLIDMVSACAGLVTIDEQSNIIRLVHYTTQEFFQRNQSTWFPKANYHIGRICLAYLSFDTFKEEHCKSAQDFTSRRDQYPFGGYAAASWGSHFRDCEADGEQLIIDEAIVELLLDRPKLHSCLKFLVHAHSAIMEAHLRSISMESGISHDPVGTPQLATSLHLAAYFGLLGVIRQLISLGVSVDCVDAAGSTPLFWTIRRNQLDAMILLLSNGADPNFKGYLGMTPLFSAAVWQNERAVQLLLEANGEVMSSDDRGQIPLHASATNGSEKVARLLLEQGTNAHLEDNDGYTPLCFAARYGRLELVQLLLDWDPDVKPRDTQLASTLSMAAENGKEAIVEFLLDRGTDPNGIDRWGTTPLIRALTSDQTLIIQLLLKRGVELEAKDHDGQTALSLAAEYENTEGIQLLLEHGADINTEDNLGRGVVFHAAWEDAYTSFPALFTSTNIRNIHQPDRYGLTPLHIAAARGNLQSVVALLKSDGVELEIKDNAGRTALSQTASCPGENTEVIQLLLEHGADINSEDNLGRGVVFYAAKEKQCTNLLALLTSTKIGNIHRPDRYGRTPLHVAASCGRLQCVLTLLKSEGVDCEAQDDFGHTALHDAIARKRLDVVNLLETFSESSEVTVDTEVEAASLLDENVYCSICMVDMLKGEAFYYCAACNGADFDICKLCYHLGARCLDPSHKLELLHER
jgi:ankyrin repeat protein